MPTTARLSRPARLLIAGNTVAALGTGLVLPLNLIYLHQVRGIPLPVVGVLLTLSAATGLVTVPVTGMLLDRVGARRVLTGLMIGQALAEAGLAAAHSAATALPAVLLLGASIAPTFPAVITMQPG